jgi:hypothetical protein
MPNPTKRTYDDLNAAYDFFNARLFDGKLPRCLITMQRRSHSYGFFAGDRFGTRDGQEVADEIALNPTHLKERTTEQTLSTLVHEMVHLQQHHFGKPGRGAYHNKEWAAMMKVIGLHPSDTGKEGGREVGDRVSHYIIADGPFARACDGLLKTGFDLAYVEMWQEGQGGIEARKKAKAKAASKTKFSCPGCGLNAWAKPDAAIICGACQVALEASGAADGEDGDGPD